MLKPEGEGSNELGIAVEGILWAYAPSPAPRRRRAVFQATSAAPRYEWIHLALAYYRAERFEEAVKRAELCPDANQMDLRTKPCVLAMAHHRLGNAEEAKKRLTETDRIYEQLVRDALATTPVSTPGGMAWWDWADFLTLRPEAGGITGVLLTDYGWAEQFAAVDQAG